MSTFSALPDRSARMARVWEILDEAKALLEHEAMIEPPSREHSKAWEKLYKFQKQASAQQHTEVVSELREIRKELSESRFQSQKRDKTFLTVAEVAELLNKSPKTIRRWTGREHFPLPVIKMPNTKQETWSFEREAVLSWYRDFEQN